MALGCEKIRPMPQNLKPTNNLSNILLNRYTSPCLIVPRCNMGKFYEIWICWIFPHQSSRTQARINELTTNYKMVFDTIYHHCQKVMMAKKMKSLQLIVVGRNQIRAVKGIFTSAAQILKNFYFFERKRYFCKFYQKLSGHWKSQNVAKL